MTRQLSPAWTQELRAQTAARRHLHHVESQLARTTAAITHVLAHGGPHWTTEIGRLELRLQEEQHARNRAWSALYGRPVLV